MPLSATQKGGRKVAKAKATPKPRVEPQRNLKRPCQEPLAGSPKVPRHQSRSTMSKVKRYYDKKLKPWQAELPFLVGAKTKLTVDDYLGIAIEKLPPGKHLTSAFWTDFFVEFRLDAKVTSSRL